MAEKVLYLLTRCDSGLRLNPLMYVFLYITLIFALAFILPVDGGLSQSVLYVETMGVADSAVNVWGIAALLSVVAHFAGFLIRGRVGTQLIQVAAFLGFFVWLWASVIYLSGGFVFQFLIGAVPNIMFWTWYAWQWRRRHNNKRVAFV